MLSIDPITALSNEHKELTHLFARHQEALVTRAWARAARLLSQYQKRLLYHIGLEERYLLPYCAEEKAGGHWRAHVYIAEHRRLEELLRKTSTRLAVARRRGVSSMALIALMDEEKTLKHVAQHHHQREDMALFESLRESLPEEARTALMYELGRADVWPERN
ncbi:MAG: hemerythrin domain-containing protein [Gammaproteobacteria bacterium]